MIVFSTQISMHHYIYVQKHMSMYIFLFMHKNSGGDYFIRGVNISLWNIHPWVKISWGWIFNPTPGVRPVDGRPFKEVEVGDCVLEAVDRFCNLGDMLSAGGGCMAAATARCRCAWGKFRENLPLLTSKPVPFDLRGRLFSSNVRSSMLHGTETWPMTSAALHRLCRNDRAMIRWICGVKPSDDPSMDELHAKLGICDLAILVRERRLRWFGHVMRSNGEINRVRSRPVPGRKGPGRPKKTWEECVKQDLKVCGLSEAGTQDRLSWRSSVKNSRHEPTPNGSLPQSMAAPPAQRFLGMRTRSFNKTGFDWYHMWRVTDLFVMPYHMWRVTDLLVMPYHMWRVTDLFVMPYHKWRVTELFVMPYHMWRVTDLFVMPYAHITCEGLLICL